MRAVILAGGKGTRLAPYTTVFPKPLMPIDDRPILDIVIRQLKACGIDRITLAVGCLAELIIAYFGDGNRWDLKIEYSKEKRPLGTAGPLAYISDLDKTFLVMNGDVLTTLLYKRLLEYHKKNKGIATIAIHERKVKIDYGVTEISKNNFLTGYIEKPEYLYWVSMGIYIFEPEILQYINKGKKLDFPELMLKLLKDKRKIAVYKTNEYWLDIGRYDDYKMAVEDFKKMKNKFLSLDR